MPAERYFYHSNLQHQSKVELTDQELHHLLHVMRTEVGETIELIDGFGTLATATVTGIKKRHAELHINTIETQPKTSHELILVQGIPRANRLDYILEKGTEIGVTKFLLLPTLLSDRKSFSDHQIERMRAILISALKQSGRLHLPEIALITPLLDWTQLPSTSFFGDLTLTAAPLLKALQETVLTNQSISFITGPESGFTAEEYEHLRNLNAIGVNLNPHVLRTDTASIIALGIIAQWNLCK